MWRKFNFREKGPKLRCYSILGNGNSISLRKMTQFFRVCDALSREKKQALKNNVIFRRPHIYLFLFEVIFYSGKS